MNEDRFETVRTALITRRDALAALCAAEEASEQELVELREPDWAETSADQAMAGRLDRVTEMLHAELRSIERALERMDAGTWGRCVACGSEIDDSRLGLSPEAAFCSTCETQREHERGAPRATRPGRRPPRWALGAAQAIDAIALEPEELAQHVLEEATEAPAIVPEEEVAIGDLAPHRPDELFPDQIERVFESGDEALEDEEPVATPPAHPRPRGRARLVR